MITSWLVYSTNMVEHKLEIIPTAHLRLFTFTAVK